MASTNLNGHTLNALPEKTHLHSDAYGVSKVLGQGGFGITYLGGDLNLHRYVAIKEFFSADCLRQGNAVHPNSTLSEDDFQSAKQKFLHEARALARFHHPNIVQVLSIFEDNNTAYMVLEFLKGKTLMQMLEERKSIPESEAIEYITQIGKALIEVHQAALLHLDIKPENVMICDDGRVVLIDFGLNKKLEKSTDNSTRALTSTTRLGSEIYAPPEQHLGNLPMNAATDVYALGATLYHLVTGIAPVPAPERAMGNKLTPPAQANPIVTTAISGAIMRAMQLKSEQRPQSVQAFLNLFSKVTAPVNPPLASTKVLSPQAGQSGTVVLSSQPVPIAQNPPANVADNSGKGAASVLPPELKGFNWGAFLLNWVWGFSNKVTWAWWALCPVVNIVIAFMLGFRGNEEAWKNRRWESIEQFKEVQKKWTYWGIGILVVSIPFWSLDLRVLGNTVKQATDPLPSASQIQPVQPQLQATNVPLTPEEKKYLSDLNNIFDTAFSTSNTDFTDANARANKSGDFEQAKMKLYYLKAPPRMVKAGFPAVASQLTNAMDKLQVAFTRMDDVDNYLSDAKANAQAGNEEMFQQDKSSAEQVATDVEQQLKVVDNMLNTCVNNYNQAYANLNAPPPTTP